MDIEKFTDFCISNFSYLFEIMVLIKRYQASLKNKIFRSLSINLNIGIALNLPQNQEIIDYCNGNIKKYNLSNIISFFDTTNKCPYNKKENVEKYLSNSKFNLIVWRAAEDIENKQGEKIIIYFTHFDDREKVISSLIKKELNSLVSQEAMLNIFSNTIVDDFEIERKNIFEFSLYLTAFSVAYFGNIRGAKIIFENLFNILKERNSILKEKTLEKLQSIYVIEANELVWKNRFIDARDILNKSFEINSLHLDTLAGLALVFFKIGDKIQSKKFVDELLSKFPRSSVTEVDVAFFRIMSGDYKNALKHYERYKDSNPDPAISIQVTAFLNERIDENPTEFGLLFGRGYMEWLGGLESLYRKDLEIFIRRASKIGKYNDLVNKARKILENKII